MRWRFPNNPDFLQNANQDKAVYGAPKIPRYGPASMKAPGTLIRVTIGVSVTLLAAFIMLGWITGTRALVQPLDGPVMVFNTALCFVLLGLAVIIDRTDSGKHQQIQQWLGRMIMLGAGLVFCQYLAGADFGLDWPSLHRWLADDNPYPGRMSPPTAIAFICTGATLALMHRVRNLQPGLLVQALTLILAAIAIAALIGQPLGLRYIYPDYLFSQMSTLTASCFLATAIALWLCWLRTGWYRSRSILTNDAQRIGLTGALTLAVVASFAVLFSFSTAQREIQTAAGNGLLQTLKAKRDAFTLIIEQRLVRAETIAIHTGVARFLFAAQYQEGDTEALNQLEKIAQSYRSLGFTGIRFLDRDGGNVLRSGEFAGQPEWSADLDIPSQTRLLWWNESPLLHTTMPVILNGKTIGTVIAEQTLPSLVVTLRSTEDSENSREIGLCILISNLFQCLPQRFVTKVFKVPYSPKLPMSHAVAGKTGIIRSIDYRNQHVLAAHGPLTGVGLGLVVKVDTAELYAPIRRQLNSTLLLLLLLSAGGGVILYMRLVPLIREIERSREAVRKQGEQALKVSEDRLTNIVSSAKDAIIAIDERRCVLLFNHAAEQMFQHDSAKIIGRPLDMLVPLRFRADYEQLIQDFSTSGTVAQSLNQSGIIHGLRANGVEFPIEATISQIGTSPDKLLTLILRDITMRRQTERLIAGQKNLLQGIAVGLPLKSSLDAICKLGETEFKDMLCSILLLDGQHLHHGAAPSLPAEFVRLIDNQPIGPTAGACGTAAYRRERVIVTDIATDPLWADYRAPALAHGLLACWSNPIFDEQFQVLGTFAIYYRQPRSPSSQEIRALETATQIAAIAIQRERATENLRELSQRLLIVEEAERRAISHELHDRIGQDLSAINLTIDLMRMQPPEAMEQDFPTRLNDMQTLIRASINNARDIMADLHPAGLEDSGLRTALQYHAKRIAQRFQLSVTVSGNWTDARLAPSVELALFRITQEAVNNIAKHAAAENIDITLDKESTANLLMLRITDDGCGFDMSTVSAQSYGLRTMRERALAINAELLVDSVPGKGTAITVRLASHPS